MASTTRPLALVTGASAGIGVSYAERLARDGWDLIITGRRRDRLDELANRLRSDHNATAEVLVADLGTVAGIDEIDAVCRDRNLEMLVNNAGLSYYMPLLDLPEERLQELVTLNVMAPTRHSLTAAKGMVKRGSGVIITVSSLLAFSDTVDMPQLPARVAYASTKAYGLMFSRLLAAELKGTGVKVQVVCPGLVKTEFHSRQNVDMSHVPRLAPEDVVQASLRALELDEVVCIPTLQDTDMLMARDDAQGTMLGAAFPPNLADRYRS